MSQELPSDTLVCRTLVLSQLVPIRLAARAVFLRIDHLADWRLGGRVGVWLWLWLWLWVWASVCVGGLSRIGRAGRGQLGRRFEFLLLSVAEISAPRKFEGNKRFGLSKQAFPALSPFLPLRLLLLLLFLTIRGASPRLRAALVRQQT